MSEIKVDLFGNKYCYNSNGKLHREDGPAVDCSNGTKMWYIDGNSHRIDGPALEWSNGIREWLLDGLRHRIDGPAVEGVNGHREWWVDGKRHRIDGPDVEYVNGDRYWYINGNRYNSEQFDEIVNFPVKKIPYISFSDSIHHIMFKSGLGIRLSYILELYIDGRYIKWDWSLGEIILGFLRSSEYIEPLLDWIQENGMYFPSEFVERLYY